MNKNEYVIAVDTAECVQCEGCVEECPVKALQIGAGGYPFCVENLCIRCGVCIEICPVMAISFE